MRPSYKKDGGAYLPCIRDERGGVLWVSEERCCNRDHSTSRGPSARDLAKLVIDAIASPDELESLLRRNPPEAIRRSLWEMETWRARQQYYRWALAIAPRVRDAIKSPA